MKRIITIIGIALIAATAYAGFYPEGEAGHPEELYEPLPTVALAGSFNEWDVTANAFAPNVDSLSASVTINLAVADYEFKIVLGGNWLSLNGEGDALYTLHREWTTASHVNLENATNFKLTADVAGEYIFTWTYADSTLTITFPGQTPVIDNQTHYLLGNTEQLGAWSLENALPMENGTISLELPAGSYAFKVLPNNDSWADAFGYTYLSRECSSANVRGDEDGNISVTTTETGVVTISITATNALCVTGSFINTTDKVYLTTGISPTESGAYVSPLSGEYEIGSSVQLKGTISVGGWMFDKWSDNGSWDNPRTITLTQDTIITAIFSPGEYGVLVNGNRFVRGTFTERLNGSYVAQFIASVQLQEGDYFQLINLFHSDNAVWRPQLEEGGSSGGFSIDETHNAIACNAAGCYNIYIKIHYGQSDDVVYIGGGYECSEGEPFGQNDVTDGFVFSLVGTENLFGSAWNTEDTLTNMKRVGDGLYEYTLDSVALTPEGDYQYKVIANHQWNIKEYPSVQEDDNYHIMVEESGVYSVLFSLDSLNGCNATPNYLHAISTGDDTGETVLCSTTFADWNAISASSTERTFVYSDITFTLYNVKVRPSEQPSSVADVSVGYIQPTSSTSCYIQTDMLPYVSRVTYVQASANAGRGWRLESSSDGENWYAFNENDEGCASANIAETREMNIYMENVWLRWTPTSTNAGSGIYLHEIAIYGIGSSSNTEPSCPIASGSCGASGDNLMWVLGCDSVLTISGEGEMPSSYSATATPWYEYGAAIKHINIEEGVTKLALNAFYNSGGTIYTNVQTLSIPSTLGAPIENNFFYGCPLKTVTINSDTIVGKASYNSGSNLQNKFGAQVEEYIFGGSVRSIANFAFYNQSTDSLRSIILPEGLEAIGNWAFGYIEHLTSISIPSTVQTIGTDAFAYCSNLRSVELGEGLMTINGQAFWMCDNLTRVTCNALTPPALNQTAFDHNRNDTLFVPCEAKESYKQADYWKNFSNILCADDTIGGNTEPDVPEEYTFTLDANWQFIMLPMVFGLTQDDIVVDGGEVAWGVYDSQWRAEGRSGWKAFNPISGFEGSQAYIVRARNGSATLTIHVPESARDRAAATMPVSYHPATREQNANWNFLGNPYPFGYNITAALDAAGIESPVTVWNGTGYSTYTPGIDEKILEPFEAFFIQLPDGGSEAFPLSPEHIKDSSDNGNNGNNGNSIADADGALPGYFTINTSKEKVRFSRGNLQYQASTATWRFAENQYEVIGDGNANISDSYDGWIDLFGWGTGDNPTKTSTSKCDYSGFVDWGINAISNGGNTADMWHTLSGNEWTYITGQRTNHDSLCGRATVNDIQGFILLPDDWVSPGVPFQGSKDNGYELNRYSLEDWQKMEAAGAVFLPACGSRTGTEFSNGAVQYWSTNAGSSCYAYDIITGGDTAFRLKTNQVERSGAYGVRLVK